MKLFTFWRSMAAFVSHCTSTLLYGGTTDDHPTVKRILERCMADERFASAHPRRQPGAPPGL